MAIEGLEIAPNGIGSGLAQVADTRFTQAAFLKNQEQKRLTKAKEEEDFAKSLASIDVDGIHKPDTEDISNEYSNLISKFGTVRKAKTRQDRLAAMADYERSKQDLLFNISNSKDFSKALGDIGSKLLGGSEEDYDMSQRLEFENLKNNKSKGVQIDQFKFIKNAKPEDILKFDKDLIDASVAPVSAKVYEGQIGDTEGFFREDGKFVDKGLFFNNFKTIVSTRPRYAKAQIELWKDVYEKEKGVVATESDNVKILNFAAQKKFELAQRQQDELNKTFSQKGGMITYSPPSVGTKTSDNFDVAYSGEVDFVNFKKESSPSGEVSSSTVSKTPIINSYPATISYESSLSGGAINGEGKVVTGSKKQLSLKSSEFVVMPVYKKSGLPLKLSSTTTSKGTGSTNLPSVMTNKANKVDRGDYEFKVFAVSSDGRKIYYVPGTSVPFNKMSVEAQAALKAAQEESMRLNGGGTLIEPTQPGGDL